MLDDVIHLKQKQDIPLAPDLTSPAHRKMDIFLPPWDDDRRRRQLTGACVLIALEELCVGWVSAWVAVRGCGITWLLARLCDIKRGDALACCHVNGAAADMRRDQVCFQLDHVAAMDVDLERLDISMMLLRSLVVREADVLLVLLRFII